MSLPLLPEDAACRNVLALARFRVLISHSALIRFAKRCGSAACALLCAVLCAGQAYAQAPPLPVEASAELIKAIKKGADFPWHLAPKDKAEWRRLAAEGAALKKPSIAALMRRLGVECEKTEINGAPVFMLTPPRMPEAHKDKILLYFHGGAYVLNPGEAGLDEGICMAAAAKCKVAAVDYRMAPDHPFPAALEDALAVYKGLLETHGPQDIGVFGSSTGGAMTLALCLLCKQERLPLPGAIAPGTPWSDLTKTGDSYYLNDGIDNVLARHDGLLDAMGKLYANGHDPKDPLISPVYGDLRGFPPTLLATGTRDLFLSNTARIHRKLREAGAPADLLVIEGLSHWQYIQLAPDSAESQYYFNEAAKFFDKWLGK